MKKEIELLTKRALCNVAYASGYYTHMKPFGVKDTLCLMYHGLVKSISNIPERNFSTFNITKDRFDRQMGYLHKYCNVISVDDAVSGKMFQKPKRT